MGIPTSVDASKSETMFQAPEDCLDNNGLSCDSLISFLVDNTGANIGSLSSVKSRILPCRHATLFQRRLNNTMSYDIV